MLVCLSCLNSLWATDPEIEPTDTAVCKESTVEYSIDPEFITIPTPGTFYEDEGDGTLTELCGSHVKAFSFPASGTDYVDSYRIRRTGVDNFKGGRLQDWAYFFIIAG